MPGFSNSAMPKGLPAGCFALAALGWFGALVLSLGIPVLVALALLRFLGWM